MNGMAQAMKAFADNHLAPVVAAGLTCLDPAIVQELLEAF